MLASSVFALGPAASFASDEVHGTFEQYFTAIPAYKGVHADFRWATMSDRFSPCWSFVTGFMQEWGWQWMDETYLSYEGGPLGLRLGRFRSAFGLSTWSDMHYTPIIALPMVRAYIDAAPGVPLYRLDRGAELTGGTPKVEYHLALVDSDESDWNVAPKTINTGIGGLQWSGEHLIVGLHGLVKKAVDDGRQAEIADLDFRWTAPRLIVRGELVTGVQGGSGCRGFYVDAFYRPVGLARTQLGLRYQGIDNSGYDGHWGWKSDVLTIGARQILNKYLTFTVNYGAGGHVPAIFGFEGWSAQMMASYRF